MATKWHTRVQLLSKCFSSRVSIQQDSSTRTYDKAGGLKAEHAKQSTYGPSRQRSYNFSCFLANTSGSLTVPLHPPRHKMHWTSESIHYLSLKNCWENSHTWYSSTAKKKERKLAEVRWVRQAVQPFSLCKGRATTMKRTFVTRAVGFQCARSTNIKPGLGKLRTCRGKNPAISSRN